LVATLGDLVVICEVKTRRSDRFGTPLEAVTQVKVRRLRRLASEWLAVARTSGEVRSAVDIRFDVASVTVSGKDLVIEVTEDAF
jgi:putative endonuclease